ncbi:MAG: alanine racemase [Desertimonas sp.]
MNVVASRWAWAEIDLGALHHNVEVMRRAVAPAGVCAVVKADAYGHGAGTIARAALDAGAAGLAVALTDEGVALREAGIEGPILLLSEQPAHDAARLVAMNLTPTVATAAGIDALAAVGGRDIGVHLKIDTGMHRVGAAPADVPALVERIARHAPRLRLAGLATHLAVADEPDDPFTVEQLRRFDEAIAALESRPEVIHVANSAGGLAHPEARRSFVRAGIALYGIEPGPGVRHLCGDLRPVMSLKARLSAVRRVAAGERVSYGLRHRFERDATIATVPIGYHDGVRRGLWDGQHVLLHGRRRPITGVVTMDQLMIDTGDLDVSVGDEVVLIGRQGDEEIRVEEWAARLGTIGYEITCGISPRVPRVLVGGARPPL